MHSQRGQSLVEILIGLGIISILVGASTYALVSVLRTSTVNDQNQTAGLIGNSLLESAFTLAEGNWKTIYDLQKGSANKYFIVNSPTTTPYAVAGEESVLSENIVNGLVGHWKFDEASANTTWAYDSSGKGNFGQLANSPTKSPATDCKIGTCLGFTGTNWVQVGNSTTLNISSDITVAAWVKGYGMFASNSTQYGMFVDWSANGIGPVRYWYWGGTTNGWINYSTVGLVPASTWTHVAIVNKPGNAQGWALPKIYVNGQEATVSGPTQETDIGDGTNFRIGEYAVYTPYYPFSGKIDDVRVYNRTLTSAEISQLYNSQFYNRHFYVENVNRKACGAGDITTDAATSCTGSANDVGEDPATQKITVGMNWDIKGVVNSLSNAIYVSRWINGAGSQTSWDGSDGTAGPVNEFSDDYFSYSDVATSTSGSLKIGSIYQ